MKECSLIIASIPLECTVIASCVPNSEINDEDREMLDEVHTRFLDLGNNEDGKLSSKIWREFLNSDGGKWNQYLVPVNLTQVNYAHINGKTYKVASESFEGRRNERALKNPIARELEEEGKIRITNVYHFAENC